MNADQLSNRLTVVARHIPKGYRIADIGSDHAYLPCHVVKMGIVPFAIAGEVVEGPYQSARKQVLSEGLTEQIKVRKGDGLEVISDGEVDCITIAGMGGSLIVNILENGKEKLHSVKRLVLQPNVSAVSIRLWLVQNQWELIEEEILEEDGKIYEILVAEKGDPLRPYQKNKNAGLLMGPFLKEHQTEPFHKKWHNEVKNWENIITQLEQATKSEENIQKKKELLDKIDTVKEVLH